MDDWQTDREADRAEVRADAAFQRKHMHQNGDADGCPFCGRNCDVCDLPAWRCECADDSLPGFDDTDEEEDDDAA